MLLREAEHLLAGRRIRQVLQLVVLVVDADILADIAAEDAPEPLVLQFGVVHGGADLLLVVLNAGEVERGGGLAARRRPDDEEDGGDHLISPIIQPGARR